MKPKPSKYQELLAVEVASGSSIKAAADKIGCKVQTAYNISCSTEFRSRVSSIRSEITAQSVGLITSAATQAAATLTSLLSETCEPSIRLNAAKTILSALGPLSEIGELRARLDALESQRLKIHA
jgi:hypothetical protein